MIETTALGAGLLAGLAAGVWSSPDELNRARRIETTFRPRQGRAWRARELSRWREAITTLLGRPGRGAAREPS